MKILITGVAGFIGFHVAQYYLSQGHTVVGVDSINDYYDVELKKSRLKLLVEFSNNINDQFIFLNEDICNERFLHNCFTLHKFDYVIHLAAQAGVRYSLENPKSYVESNIVGFLNILEACRFNSVQHLVYASTSSVYGANLRKPFSENHGVDHPLQFYAATKRSNELMAHSYSHLYGLQTTGLRFFTVYGPWGRPDMALFKFTKNIIEDEPINLYNYGNHERDFTYIDDIVAAIHMCASSIPIATSSEYDLLDPSKSKAPFRILNVGSSRPIKLIDFVSKIEDSLNIKAKINFLPLQPGDVEDTHADIAELIKLTNFNPKTSIEEGVLNFVNWYRRYYEV